MKLITFEKHVGKPLPDSFLKVKTLKSPQYTVSWLLSTATITSTEVDLLIELCDCKSTPRSLQFEWKSFEQILCHIVLFNLCCPLPICLFPSQYQYFHFANCNRGKFCPRNLDLRYGMPLLGHCIENFALDNLVVVEATENVDAFFLEVLECAQRVVTTNRNLACVRIHLLEAAEVRFRIEEGFHWGQEFVRILFCDWLIYHNLFYRLLDRLRLHYHSWYVDRNLITVTFAVERQSILTLFCQRCWTA